MTGNPGFKSLHIYKSNISKNGASYGQSYYRTLTGHHTLSCLSNGTTFDDLE